jgi:biotin carboxylase
MGLETVVIDGDPQAPLAAEADRFEPVDLKNLDKIEALARELQVHGGLHAVMTAGTDFSASVAWAAEKTGLPGIPYETALDASDKERMRLRFKEASLPSPAFQIFSSLPVEGLSLVEGMFSKEECLPFPFPAVVKPVDNMGARGCRRVDTVEELGEAVKNALKFSRSGRAIVEEYMEGPEFSIDAVVYRGEVTICGLADRHIFFPPYFIEMGHTMPANIPQQDQDALIDLFIRGIRALGINNGAAKGDIKLTRHGPMIGEIAARLSGGYMSGWTYPYASGADPCRGALCTALGLPPEGLRPLRNWTSAERAFISIPGMVQSIHGVEAARNIPGVKDLFLRAAPGQRLSFPENNVSKAGNVISAAVSRDGAVKAAEEAARTVLIRLAVPDVETGAFLSGPVSGSCNGTVLFPPPAFTLNSHLQQELEKLPGSLPQMPPGGLSGARLIPFPGFTGSDLRDYGGRTVRESLEIVRQLTGLALVETAPDMPALGREFWTALVRGGYQGGTYYIDCFLGGLPCDPP